MINGERSFPLIFSYNIERRKEKKGERVRCWKKEIEEKGQAKSKNKGRKSANEYTQVRSVAVTTCWLIASSQETAYLMNNTDTHTVETTEPSISPQAIVICIGFSGDQKLSEHSRLCREQKWHMSICPQVCRIVMPTQRNQAKAFNQINQDHHAVTLPAEVSWIVLGERRALEKGEKNRSQCSRSSCIRTSGVHTERNSTEQSRNIAHELCVWGSWTV